jgi:hypothetical protein
LAFLHEGRLFRTVALDRQRPDVAQKLPQAARVERCGFHALLGVLTLPPQFELRLDAVLEDGRRVPMARIQGQHEGVRSGFEPTLTPLLVTMLGRVGSSWLIKLLSQHPAIVAHPAPPYEIRVATYWMQVLRVLAEPANHAESSPFADFHKLPWSVGHHPFYSLPVIADSRLHGWFGRVYPERLTAFCAGAIESFYQELAKTQGRGQVSYFAEKSHPDWVPWAVRNVYPRVREVFLVRDFRDMLCSILAFNQKRGYASFGRERVSSDEEFVRQLGADSQKILRSWKKRRGEAHLMRYEDLILSPTETLTAALAYLELPPTPSTVQSMMQQAAKGSEELAYHRTMVDGAASIGRWQRDLSPALRTLCQDVLGELLDEFGYGSH